MDSDEDREASAFKQNIILSKNIIRVLLERITCLRNVRFEGQTCCHHLTVKASNPGSRLEISQLTLT